MAEKLKKMKDRFKYWDRLTPMEKRKLTKQVNSMLIGQPCEHTPEYTKAIGIIYIKDLLARDAAK